MSDPVRAIADAVLYEGYLLWPYRRSALKNRQRFTWGGVYPHGWPEGPSRMRTECLLEGEAPSVTVSVRFLQVVERQPLDADGAEVDELVLDGERYLGWEEAVERELEIAPARRLTPIKLPAGEEREELLDSGGRSKGALRRRWRELSGLVESDVEELGPRLRRVAVEVRNEAEWGGEGREEALKRTLCATHAVLRVDGGAFVSLTDPPPALASEAEHCRNEGVWPVLVGEPGERGTLLASPIILEDHPRVAPESPGDLFDGGEIDQLLTLSILALTDAEKEEVRATDPRAREILERTEAMGGEELMRLHGTIRERRTVGR